MFDWYSAYTVIQARQREMVEAARIDRLLSEARGLVEPGIGRRGRSPSRRPAQSGSAYRNPGLRYRLGAALVLMGRRLQEGAPQLPAAVG